MRTDDTAGRDGVDAEDRDDIQDVLDRLAAEDAERLAELREHVAEDRKQVRAFLKDVEERLAGIRIPPPSIAAGVGGGRGRRPKLTPEVCWAICEALSQGAPLRTAAAAAGIGKATLHRWLARGRAETEGPYRDFRDRVREVSMLVHVHAVASIRASKSWRAHAWFLERRYPRTWGRRRLELVAARLNSNRSR